MKNSRQFYQLDVFTEKAFAGNPLAVFLDGAHLSTEQMQQIAREMNLSETVFVLASEQPEALRRLRIFTPARELPMAGHPVVGTWNLLAQLGVIENCPANGAIEIKHELNIGVLPVEIEFADGKPAQVTMTQGTFTAGEIVRDEDLRRRIADAFDLSLADLSDDAPIQVAGTGVDFTIVPVRSLEVLRGARPNQIKLEELPAHLPGEFSLFTRESIENDASAIHTRMFAPEFGIIEDPATGAAAGALAGYLLHHGLLGGDRGSRVHRFTIEQGDFIKRPSRIKIEVTGEKANVERVRVGGKSVVVAKGELFFW